MPPPLTVCGSRRAEGVHTSHLYQRSQNPQGQGGRKGRPARPQGELEALDQGSGQKDPGLSGGSTAPERRRRPLPPRHEFLLQKPHPEHMSAELAPSTWDSLPPLGSSGTPSPSGSTVSRPSPHHGGPARQQDRVGEAWGGRRTRAGQGPGLRVPTGSLKTWPGVCPPLPLWAHRGGGL